MLLSFWFFSGSARRGEEEREIDWRALPDGGDLFRQSQTGVWGGRAILFFNLRVVA